MDSLDDCAGQLRHVLFLQLFAPFGCELWSAGGALQKAQRNTYQCRRAAGLERMRSGKTEVRKKPTFSLVLSAVARVNCLPSPRPGGPATATLSLCSSSGAAVFPLFAATPLTCSRDVVEAAYFCSAFFSAACFTAAAVHGGTIPFARA